MFNVKSKQDYDNLSWEDKMRYNEQNRGNQYAKDELKRTERVLYTNPTDSARNWYAQQKYVAGGGSADNAILGNFDKSAYQWEKGVGVRSAMNDMAISDDRIGYQNGKVTLDGRDFMTPDVVADGRSYASGDALRQAFVQYNQNHDIVPARSYINSKNPNINVGWDGNLDQVKVGSVLMQPDYIQDGVAYVSRAKVDAAIAREQNLSGMYSRQDILNQSNDRWESRIDRLYDKVENPEPFSYSAESDPLYQEFKREYMKQAQNQYDDTIAKMNTQSGGAPSLGAMAAAWNMYDDSLSQLDAYKQQFRQQAYSEYVDEYNRDLARLEAAMGLRSDEFNRAYGVNNDIIDDEYMRRDWENLMANDALNRRAAEQAYQQSEQLFPYELGTAKANLDTILYSLELNKKLEPYELKQLEQAVLAGDIELNEMQRDALARQLSGATFSGSRSSGGYSGGADITSEPVDWEAEYENTQGENTASVLPRNIAYTFFRPESQAYTQAVSVAQNMLGNGSSKEAAVRYIARESGLSSEDVYKILSNPGLFGMTQEEMDEVLKQIN